MGAEQIDMIVKVGTWLFGSGFTVIGGKFVYKKVIAPHIQSTRSAKMALVNKIEDIHATVKKELNFNGQGSLKDAVLRLEKGQISLEKGQVRINTRLDVITETQHTCMNLQRIAYWKADEDGEFVYASPSLCEIMGRNESELLGNNWVAWIIEDDKKRIFEAWKFSVENESPFDEIFTVKRKDGKRQRVAALAFQSSETMGRLNKIDEPF